MSLIALQKKIGVTPDGVFGPATLRAAMRFYKLTPVRAAHFFGQVSHETGNFRVFSENLNYSANGLRKVFPKHFPDDQIAKQYERKPEKIANKVYANRMGNRSEESGDGWKYRGRGALQLTGYHNYFLFSEYYNRPEVMADPDPVATDLAFESAMFFFVHNKLWSICDGGVTDSVILALTKRINGGTHGLDDRKEKTYRYFSMLT